MMIGQSEKIRKMVKYYNIMASVDETWSKLDSKARGFVNFVEQQLPENTSHWATKIYPEKANDEAQKKLISDIMFEEGKRPSTYAKKAAQKFDNESIIPIGAQDALRYVLDYVRQKEEEVLKTRKEYFEVLSGQEKVRRQGDWPLFRAAQKVRTRVENAEEGAPTRIDRMQSLVQPEVSREVGVPTTEESPGERAVSNLVVENQLAQEAAGGENAWETDETNRDENLEAAAWAQFLSMAMSDTQGYRANRAEVAIEIEDMTIKNHPEVVLQN